MDNSAKSANKDSASWEASAPVVLLVVVLEETTVFAAMVLLDSLVTMEVIANRAYRAQKENAPAPSNYYGILSFQHT